MSEAVTAKPHGYTDVEFMICMAARTIEDGKSVFVGYGMPQIAAILAQRMYASEICQIYEYGAIGPQVATPFRRNMMADARNSFRAFSWMSMNPIMFQASVGLVDYGILGAAQLDKYGNINSTQIGKSYKKPKKRFTGSGGGNEVASLCWRTILLMRHEKRRFLEKVDFITSPGYLDGSLNARENAGLPKGTGPYRVITSMGLFDFDHDTNIMRIIGTAPDVTVDDIKNNMEFEPKVANVIEQLEPPKPDELKLLRDVIDPDRVVIGSVK
jgi:glutaconate CoA-transferase subunit B